MFVKPANNKKSSATLLRRGVSNRYKLINMKTIKLLIPAVAFAMFCMTAQAGNDNGDAAAKNHVISVYIDAMTKGNIDEIGAVLDPNVKLILPQGRHLSTYGRSDILSFFRRVQNIRQDCTTSTTVIENGAMNVVKVDMKFNSFVRSNFVTLANNGRGWKIINVYTIFN
jgi:hypothetical protein